MQDSKQSCLLIKFILVAVIGTIKLKLDDKEKVTQREEEEIINLQQSFKEHNIKPLIGFIQKIFGISDTPEFQ